MGFFNREQNNEREFTEQRDRELDRQNNRDDRNFIKQRRDDRDKQKREDRELSRKEKRMIKKEQKEIQRASDLASASPADKNLRKVKSQGFLEKFQRRNEPDNRRARIHEKSLIAQEEILKTKIKKAKHDRKKLKISDIMKARKSASKKRGGSRARGRGREFDPVRSVGIEPSSGQGLRDMFGAGGTDERNTGSGLSEMFGAGRDRAPGKAHVSDGLSEMFGASKVKRSNKKDGLSSLFT